MGKSGSRSGATGDRARRDQSHHFSGRLTEDQLIAELATCRAVCFPPFQEDYGFVTVEAFASRKAVITCRDSGGPAELVKDGVNGFVCEPTPEALGARCGGWSTMPRWRSAWAPRRSRRARNSRGPRRCGNSIFNRLG